MDYKQYIIGSNLRRFSPQSFYRFGDKNSINKIVYANYMKNNGTPIDSQAKEMSEIYNPLGDGNEIEPQDIVDFVSDHLRNPFVRKIKPDFEL